MFELLTIGTNIKDISLEDLDLNMIHRKFSYKTVNLMVPKFRISQTLDLKEILSKLGVRRAFSDQGTDLGSLVGNFNCGYYTVWKFSNFPTKLILRKIHFG